MKHVIIAVIILIFPVIAGAMPNHFIPRPQAEEERSQLLRVPEEVHYIDELKTLIARKNWKQPRKMLYNVIQYPEVRRRMPTLWPVQGGGIITSPYGLRFSPFSVTQELHTGIDIAFGPGVPIVAAADGIVTNSETNMGYGVLVVVDHSYGFSTFYGHLMRTSVKNGDIVRKGQIIGYMGSTGRAAGVHLHFEVRINSIAVNPRYFMFIHSF